MNPITDLWRQLVRRRLWPVALLLVGAIAAVPFVLAKDPAATEPPASPAANVAADNVTASLATEPIVSLEDPAAKQKRKPLGDKHDIFKPTKKAPKVEKVKTAAVPKTETTPTETSTPAKDPSSGSSPGGGTPTPVDPTPAPEPPKTYPAGSLLVRFSGDQSSKSTLKRRGALPSAASPLIIYLGLTDRGKTAVFLLDSTIKAQGDGECHPTPENCETLHLKAGETEFFDTVDATGVSTGSGFQLDLIKIHKPKSSDDDQAARSAGLARMTKAVTPAAGFGDVSLHSRGLGAIGRTG